MNDIDKQVQAVVDLRQKAEALMFTVVKVIGWLGILEMLGRVAEKRQEKPVADVLKAAAQCIEKGQRR